MLCSLRSFRKLSTCRPFLYASLSVGRLSPFPSHCLSPHFSLSLVSTSSINWTSPRTSYKHFHSISGDEEDVPHQIPSRYADAYAAIELALDSVVKIFNVSSSPNYFLPWQNKSQRETMGSGFIIPGQRILTNAHVVADHTFVLVRKHGSPTKYRAEVQAVGHECDLAILTVENVEFWDGLHFVELGDIPLLQESVAVVGYPQGGDNISVTKGVVSRVEPTQYVHDTTQLMTIQIDAAINPRNSGGPAIMGDKVAGVAFQNLSGAENIGAYV